MLLIYIPFIYLANISIVIFFMVSILKASEIFSYVKFLFVKVYWMLFRLPIFKQFYFIFVFVEKHHKRNEVS